MTTLIHVDSFNITRGKKHILRVLFFEPQEGSITGMIGPSGSGKTTLLRAIVGVQKYQGELHVLGHPAGDAANRGRIGYMTQSASVYEGITVRQNLSYFPSSRVQQPRLTAQSNSWVLPSSATKK